MTVLWEGRPHSQGHSSRSCSPSQPGNPSLGPTSSRPSSLSPCTCNRFRSRTTPRRTGLRFLNSPLQALIGSFKTQPSQLSSSPIGLYGTRGGSSGASHRSHESSAVERDLKGERKAERSVPENQCLKGRGKGQGASGGGACAASAFRSPFIHSSGSPHPPLTLKVCLWIVFMMPKCRTRWCDLKHLRHLEKKKAAGG